MRVYIRSSYLSATLCVLARRDVIIPHEDIPNHHAPQTEIRHRRLTPNQLHRRRPLLPSADLRPHAVDVYISNCWHQGIPLGSAMVCTFIEEAVLTLTVTGWNNKCWFASSTSFEKYAWDGIALPSWDCSYIRSEGVELIWLASLG